MAYSASDDFNLTEGFSDFDQTPYDGGYDIALTYGRPLPPSDSICYPISFTGSGSPPPPPPHSLPEKPKISSSEGYGDGVQDSEQRPPSYDYNWPQPEPYLSDLSAYNWPRPEPYSSDPSGYNYPFSPLEDWGSCGRRYGANELGCGRRWGRIADYLFGYSQGYGEKRDGTDSFGNPIYAYKRQGYEEPLRVLVEPQKPNYYEVHHEEVYPLHSESWSSSSYDERRYESHRYDDSTYNYEGHHSEQPLFAQVEPTAWSQNSSYHEAYQEQVHHPQSYQLSLYDERTNESYSHGNPNYAYERHYNEQSLSVQVEPIELTWSQNPSYNEVYGEQVSPKSNYGSSSYGSWWDGSHFYGNTNHAYEKHYYEQPLSVQVEPIEPTWSEKPSYYEAHNEVMYSKSNRMDHYNAGLGSFGDVTARNAILTTLPADWWINYGDDCPELQTVAIRVLSQTTSSSNCERNWSTFSLIHTRPRNRLSMEKLDKLVYIQYNLNLRSRTRRRLDPNKRKNYSCPVDLDYIFSEDNDPLAPWIEERELPVMDAADDLGTTIPDLHVVEPMGDAERHDAYRRRSGRLPEREQYEDESHSSSIDSDEPSPPHSQPRT